MKNTIKMSLVAAIAVAGLTTTSSAATLAEAFAASTVKGELKSLYFQKDGKDAQNSSIWVNGGNVSLKTGSYNGLTAGVTFQTSHVASYDEDKGATGYKSKLGYAGDLDASGSVMSEAYLAYTMANTTAKIGRQFISTPLLAGSGSRMIKESFEAALLVNTDLPDTTVVAGVINKYQKRTDSNGAPGEFNNIGDGVYTVYAKNSSIDNLTVQAQYASITAASTNAGEDINAFYADASYKLNMVTLAAQTSLSDNGKANNNSNGSLYGVKASVAVSGVNLTAAYTTTDDEAKVERGIGESAYKTFTGAGMIGAGAASYNADTNSYLVSAAGKVAGFALKLTHAAYDDKVNSTKMEETNFTAGYAFDKNLSAKVSYSAFNDYKYDNRVRTYLTYKF